MSNIEWYQPIIKYQQIPVESLFRCRGCNTNLASNNSASRYQKQKLIQNTVRVYSSLYAMNLAALNVYQSPSKELCNVNWNQMSDRKIPHIQTGISGNGGNPGGNSLKRTLTSLKPGALTPGGAGVDIKHNSYYRYLARLKGKGPIKRGAIPPYYGLDSIPFNYADPIYGGKEFKTSIVSNCNCPGGLPNSALYNGNFQEKIYNVPYDISGNITRYVDKCGSVACNLNNFLNKQFQYKNNTIPFIYSLNQNYLATSDTFAYVSDLMN